MSVIVMVAARLPKSVGVNVAATLQLALGTKLLTVRQSVPLEGVTGAKSPAFVPPRAALVMFSAALPVFVKVTVCCAVTTPKLELPNDMVVELKLATG